MIRVYISQAFYIFYSIQLFFYDPLLYKIIVLSPQHHYTRVHEVKILLGKVILFHVSGRIHSSIVITFILMVRPRREFLTWSGKMTQFPI
jgi:hypothetical protein